MQGMGESHNVIHDGYCVYCMLLGEMEAGLGKLRETAEGLLVIQWRREN